MTFFSRSLWQLSAAINKIWQNLALTLQFCHRLAEPYLAKGRRPFGYPAPCPSPSDMAGASPYDAKPSCWRTMAWHLPRRTSSDGAINRPPYYRSSRAYKSARLLRYTDVPLMRPIDVLFGVSHPQNPCAWGEPPDPHQLVTHRRQSMS